MQRSTLIVFGLCAMILASCGGPVSVEYRLTFKIQDPAAVEELSKATLRVIERRLERMNVDLLGQDITKDADGFNLKMDLPDAASAQALTEEMIAPFDLHIMVEAASATGSDITVEGIGSFSRSGVTGNDLGIIRSGTKPDNAGGYVLITFTDEGLVKMSTIFKENVGRRLGLFVRGNLVSALTVMNADLPNPLVIDGIPNPELAAIFTDDVNVGTYVTVSPL